jgi:transmembrane sensor
MESQTSMNDLIVRYLNGTIEKRELQVLHDWLKADTENTRHFNQVCLILKECAGPGAETGSTDKALERLHIQINEWETGQIHDIHTGKHSINRKLVFRRLAAALLVLIGLSAVLLYVFQQSDHGTALPDNGYFTIIAPRNQKSRIILSDGTKVWLNCGTSIKYAATYGQATRDIYLDGEAFFEVAKDPAHPFLVHASSLVVKALGTTFNVKCYPEDQTIETTLVEGKVEVERKDGQIIKARPVILHPNQKAIFNKTNKKVSVSQLIDAGLNSESRIGITRQEMANSLEAVISWKDQELVFENEPLFELTKRLERWYNVSFEIKDSISLMDNKYTGKFVNNESLDQVLMIISRTTPISYSIHSGKVTIKSE